MALCCLREMGTLKFRDPGPHIPSNMGMRGPISLEICSPWVPRTPEIGEGVDRGVLQGFRDRQVVYMQE